jgi:translation initiation factor IF-3
VQAGLNNEKSAYLRLFDSRILLYPRFFIIDVYTEVRTISTKDNKQTQINEGIRASEVRLIDENGEMRGIFSLDEALRLAEQADLDLVNISPNAVPPVCKILDYGKYRYEQQKKEKTAKKNQHVTEIKEIRLSASIEDHDVEVKAKNAIKFLQDGDKVKVSLRFRGRERDYTQLGYDAMNKFAEMVSDYGVIEKAPKMEGRRMNMFLAPKKDKK